MRSMVWFALAIVSLCSALNNAYAVSGDFEGKRFKAWTGSCESGRQGQNICFLEQVLKQNGNDVLRAIIGYAPGKPYPTVFFELPSGIDIEAGVALKVDKKKSIRFQGRCTQALCSAGFILNPSMMKQFLKGRTAVVTYSPSVGQQLVRLPVSLMGVTAGLKALRR
ncbi:MAG: invasion associated locus B family protein [Thiolinea sp.]